MVFCFCFCFTARMSGEVFAIKETKIINAYNLTFHDDRTGVLTTNELTICQVVVKQDLAFLCQQCL